jgi:ankyrin repeat protein
MGRSKNSEYSSGAKNHRCSDSYQAIVAAWKDGGLTGLKQHMTAAVAGFSDHTQDLLAAASDGHSAVVRQLLAAGADGAAALRDAVRAEDTRAVKQLLGAVTMTSALCKAVSGADEDGRTPLHIAAYSEFAVKLLLDAGAAVSAADKQGRTPLHEATVVGEDETLELLIAARAAVAAADKQGRTPLHEAAAAGHAATVELLLAAGATVHAADKDGTTPLHDAACWGSEDDGTSHARTDHRPDKAAWKKKLQQQRKEAVRLLMASEADACTADAACRTPLLLAAERGRSSIVEVLLSTSSKQVQAGRIAAVQQAAIDAGHTDTAAVLGGSSSPGSLWVPRCCTERCSWWLQLAGHAAAAMPAECTRAPVQCRRDCCCCWGCHAEHKN